MTSQKPYVGLRALTGAENDIFFGRETCVQELVQLLAENRFFAVVGEAYCGKTSLLQCGLHAHLQTLGDWHVATMRPGLHPFAALTQGLLHTDALGALYANDFANQELALQFMQQHLGDNSFSLHYLLDTRPLPPGHKLLLICDQFEEIFDYHARYPEKAKEFINLLLDSTKPHPVRRTPQTVIHVVLGLRSSHVDACADFPELAQWLKKQLYWLPRLTVAQLRQVITEPARVHQGSVAEELVNQLLREMHPKPDGLLLLQHLLMRMWELVPPGLPYDLDLAQYHKNKITNLEHALSAHLEDTYAELRDYQHETAEILFRHLLVTPPQNHRLHQPVSLAVIANIAQVSWQEVAEVVNVFRRHGRNFLRPDKSVELKADSLIEISHDVVVRYWQRLETWRQVEIDMGQHYRWLQQKAQQHQQSRSDFLTQAELMQIWHWYRQNPPSALWAQHYQCDLPLIEVYITRSVIYRVVWAILLIGLGGFLLFSAVSAWNHEVAEKNQKQQLMDVFNQLNPLIINENNSVPLGKSLTALLSQHPDNADGWFYFGLALGQQKQWAQAAVAFEQALKLTPDHFLALSHWGIALQAQQKWLQAEQIFNQALRQQPDNVSLLHHLADTLVEKKEWPLALLHYQRALGIEPKNDVILGKVAQILDLQGKSAEAFGYFTKALTLNKDNDNNWRNLGLLYKKQAKLAEAEKCFREAVRVNAMSDMNLRNLGSVLVKQAKLPEAIQVFSQAAKINPANDKNWLSLGDALSSNHNLDEALKAYNQAVKIQRNSVNLTHLADLLHKQNRADEAIKTYRDALAVKAGKK